MSGDDTQFVESWDSLSKAELIEECKARGLPITGAKPALVARLEKDEAEQEQDVAEMAADEAEDVDPPESPDQPAETVSDGPSALEELPAGHDLSKLGQAPEMVHEYHAEFDLPESFEFLHEELDHNWKIRARNEAIEAGHSPIGGAFAAHNIAMGSRDGKATIVYAVPINPTKAG